MNPGGAVVFVIDDDRRVRDALSRLLSSVGLMVETFASAAEYLAFEKPDCPSCLLLDLQLPDVNGLELQRQLVQADAPPVIIITGHGDIPTTVRAMKAGAVEFLSKPLDEQELLRAIETAVALDRSSREKRSELVGLRDRYHSLTPREKEVLTFIVAGLSNKQVAGKLGTAENTIAVHRSQIMRKMESRSIAELVRMADKLEIPPSN